MVCLNPLLICPTNPVLQQTALEDFPTELKLSILRYTDFKTLRSVVLASPSFHAIYLRDRENLLSNSTIRELTQHSIDTFDPTIVCEVRLTSNKAPCQELKDTMQYIWDHLIGADYKTIRYDTSRFLYNHDYNQANDPPAPVTSAIGSLKLTISQCCALLAIEELIPWGFWPIPNRHPACARGAAGRNAAIEPGMHYHRISCADILCLDRQILDIPVDGKHSILTVRRALRSSRTEDGQSSTPT